MKKHVLTETNYCATMYESRPIDGQPSCTAAGRYIDTDGRVICKRCAVGRVVTKLTKIPTLLLLVDQLLTAKEPLTEALRDDLRVLVVRGSGGA